MFYFATGFRCYFCYHALQMSKLWLHLLYANDNCKAPQESAWDKTPEGIDIVSRWFYRMNVLLLWLLCDNGYLVHRHIFDFRYRPQTGSRPVLENQKSKSISSESSPVPPLFKILENSILLRYGLFRNSGSEIMNFRFMKTANIRFEVENGSQKNTLHKFRVNAMDWWSLSKSAIWTYLLY